MIIAMFIAMQAAAAIPAAVSNDLATWCAGWRLAPVIPEVDAEIRGRTPEWPPNLIFGDFDANGQRDIAVLAECPKNGGRSTVQVLAYLAGKEGFTRFALEKPEPLDEREFLHLIIGGSKGGYGRDAIGVEFHTIGGHTWIFQDQKWQLVREP